MINQYTELDNPLAFIDLILWFSSIVITFLIVIYTILKYSSRKAEIEKYQKENILTWVLTIGIIGIGNTLNIIWRFIIQDIQIAEFIDYISVILCFVALFIKILNIERGINRSEFFKGYYFSIILLIAIMYTAIIGPAALKELGLLQTIYLLLLSVSFLIFPLLFLYLAMKSTDSARKNALKVVLGSILFGVGLLFQAQNIQEYAEYTPNFELISALFTIICPIMITLGIIIFFSSYKRTL
jgi:hypothetical protein